MHWLLFTCCTRPIARDLDEPGFPMTKMGMALSTEIRIMNRFSQSACVGVHVSVCGVYVCACVLLVWMCVCSLYSTHAKKTGSSEVPVSMCSKQLTEMQRRSRK